MTTEVTLDIPECVNCFGVVEADIAALPPLTGPGVRYRLCRRCFSRYVALSPTDGIAFMLAMWTKRTLLYAHRVGRA
jgi:hypothetical protein